MNASTNTYPPPRRETTAGLYSNTLVCIYIYYTKHIRIHMYNAIHISISFQSLSLSKLLSKNSVGQLKASRLDLSESSSWTFQIGLKKRGCGSGSDGRIETSISDRISRVVFIGFLFRIRKKTQMCGCLNDVAMKGFWFWKHKQIIYMLLSCLKLITQNHVGQTHRHT